MTKSEHNRSIAASRRALLRGAAVFAGGVTVLALGLSPRPAQAAQKKISQALAGYQATPKGHQRCDNCVQWQPPAACKIVDGDIAPSGWCNIYAANG